MSRRSNREGQKLTLSWLDEAGVRERDLQEKRAAPLAKMPVVLPPAQASRVSLTSVELDRRIERNELRMELDRWAIRFGYPLVVVEHLALEIAAGEAGWNGFFATASNPMMRRLWDVVEDIESPHSPPRVKGEPLTVISCGSCHAPLKFPGYTRASVREKFQQDRCGVCLRPMFPPAAKEGGVDDSSSRG